MRQPKPYFRKQKKTWYVQLRGRQLSLGKNETEAYRRYHELMASNAPVGESATVEQLFERYLDWVEEHRKPATYDKIRRNLSAFARFIGKQQRVSKITGADLSNWVESEKTWGSTTRNEAIGNVIRCLNWAVGKRHISSHNVSSVPDKPRRKRRETTFTEAEWTTLRSHVPDRQFGDFLDFLRETGCRPIEARTMEARHVDLDASLVIFKTSEAKGERHQRVIYLTERAKEIVARLMDRHPTGPLMRNTRGGAWTKDSVNCRCQRLSKKLGKPVFAYAIRHTYATDGLKAGADAIVLAELLGHRDTSMLAKTYAHLAKDADFLKRQAQRLSNRA